MARKIARLCSGALGALLVASGAAAQPVDPVATANAAPQFAADVGASEVSAQISADRKLLDRAVAAMRRRRGAGLVPHLPALNSALDKSLTAKPDDPSVYAAMSLVLSSYYNNTSQTSKALAVAEKGLRHSPLDPRLAGQKATALISLKRPEQALTTLDAAIAGDEGAKVSQARLHRLRGAVLIQLGRLDDAEASLKQAQSLQPRHQGPAIGLKLIAQMRRTTFFKPSVKGFNGDELTSRIR